MDTSSTEVTTDFASLLWDDLLFPYVFPHLTIKDLFMLRGCSRLLKKLVECYFSRMKTCDLTMSHVTITPVAFSVLIEHCSRLRHFYINYCYSLTNSMLKNIFLNNKSLTHIDLSFCGNITSAVLQPVILYQKELTYLKLENCSWLTSGCLEALALHHSNLEVLNLNNCAVADVQSIIILLQRSKNLKNLSLSGVHCVTDSVMAVIAHCNSKLKYLNVHGCQQVTCYGAMIVSEYCKELVYLNLTRCSIAPFTLKHLEKKIRSVRFETFCFNNEDPYSYAIRVPV